MDRLSAFLLTKQQLRERSSRCRAQVAEAVMGALAERLAAPVELWAVLGLIAQADFEFSRTNGASRGQVAAEHARAEGLDPASCAVLRGWRAWRYDESAGDLTPAALVVSELVASCVKESVDPDALEDAVRACVVMDSPLLIGDDDELDPQQLDEAFALLGVPRAELASLLAAAASNVFRVRP